MSEKWELKDAISTYEKLLLDTNILIDEFDGHSSLLRSIPLPQRCVPVVALWEFLTGAKGKTLPRDLVRRKERWLRDHQIKYLDFHENTANDIPCDAHREAAARAR